MLGSCSRRLITGKLKDIKYEPVFTDKLILVHCFGGRHPASLILDETTLEKNPNPLTASVVFSDVTNTFSPLQTNCNRMKKKRVFLYRKYQGLKTLWHP